MSKKIKQESVLHDWVCDLPFQMQALLMTCMRGPDENNKYNAAKAIIRYLRGTICKAAGNWSGTNNNDFMWGEYDKFHNYASAFWNDHDEYPHHFIMHLVHCAEVIGYKHYDEIVRAMWAAFYDTACISFHLNPETEEQLDKRLNDFGCGIHNNKKPIFRIYKDTDMTQSSTILGAMQCDVTEEEFNKWNGEKRLIYNET